MAPLTDSITIQTLLLWGLSVDIKPVSLEHIHYTIEFIFIGFPTIGILLYATSDLWYGNLMCAHTSGYMEGKWKI